MSVGTFLQCKTNKNVLGMGLSWAYIILREWPAPARFPIPPLSRGGLGVLTHGAPHPGLGSPHLRRCPWDAGRERTD